MPRHTLRCCLRVVAALTVPVAFGSVEPAQAAGAGAREEAALQGTRVFAASELLPFTPRRARFRLHRAEGAGGEEVDWSRLSAEDGTNRWRIDVPGYLAALLERDSEGAVWIVANWDHEKRQHTRYHPPALLLPARLGPGTVATSESEATVYDTEDGSARATGRCRHRVRRVGTERVETPAGEFEAVRVDVDRHFDMPMAQARVTVELYFVPGLGRVKHRTIKRIAMLGWGRKAEDSMIELVAEQGAPSLASGP